MRREGEAKAALLAVPVPGVLPAWRSSHSGHSAGVRPHIVSTVDWLAGTIGTPGLFPDTASAAAENVGILSKSRCRTDDISDYCHAFDTVADLRLAIIIRQWQMIFRIIFNQIGYFNSLGTV